MPPIKLDKLDSVSEKGYDYMGNGGDDSDDAKSHEPALEKRISWK